MYDVLEMQADPLTFYQSYVLVVASQNHGKLLYFMIWSDCL